MNTFLLSKFFCDDLKYMIAFFWWNSNEGEQKLHWCSWDRLCNPKLEGGLGVRNFYVFNLALLAKLGWRLMTKPASLLPRTLKAKYFPNQSFLDVPVKPEESYCWKSICAARKIIKLGCRWQVGNG